MKQEVLVGLIVVTLITNVVLGIELYNVLNKPTAYGAVSSTSTTPTTSTVAPNSSFSGQFSYTFHLELHVKKGGKYIISVDFTYPDEVVIVYLENGETVTLTPTNQVGIINMHKGDITLTVLVSGKYYGEEPSAEEVFKSLNLTVTYYGGGEED